jgi:hypothetical protein
MQRCLDLVTQEKKRKKDSNLLLLTYSPKEILALPQTSPQIHPSQLVIQE